MTNADASDPGLSQNYLLLRAGIYRAYAYALRGKNRSKWVNQVN